MKRIKRIFISCFLFAGLVLAILLTIKAYCVNEWNTVASALAVITAIIAAFLSVRIIWKQEDDYEPDIIIFFDLDSRGGIIQLVVKNIGGSNAYDIKLNWLLALHEDNGDQVYLPYVPVLSKNDSIRLFIGKGTERFENASREGIKLVYKGEIQFKFTLSSKRFVKKHFEISLEQFRHKIWPNTDEQQFHLKNVNLNKSISEISETLKVIADKFDKSDQ